jgi:hypothetical protein
MKTYPSIPKRAPDFKAYIFDKLDGSNLRSEWSKKRGWYKHGRRKGLLDSSNPHLEEAMPELFNLLLAEPLAKLAHDKKWQKLTVFYEFWGDRSIAGLHYEGDPKYLTLFDAAIDKRGIIGPKSFLKHFDGVVPTARFLGIHNWTSGFVERVLRGEFEGITFEGVVGKAGEGHKVKRAKAKTQAWKDRVREVHGTKAEAILLS